MHEGQVEGGLDDPVDDPVHHHIGLELALDVGFLDLDRDLAAVFECGFVHLGEGGRGYWLLIKL